MWIFLGVLIAFLVWFVFKLSIVSLYVILFLGIVLGVVMQVMATRRYRGREHH